MRAKSPNIKTFCENALSGKGEIFKKTRSGDVCQFPMYLPTERKYIRRSFKTRDYLTVKDRAEEQVFKIYTDVSSGKQIFGITLEELVERFLEWRQKDVTTGLITQGRHVTKFASCKEVLRVKSANIKISKIIKISFFDWRQIFNAI